MPAGYSHTTRVDGELITAAKYNGDHVNHIDNGVPGILDDYSSTIAQADIQTDPGEVGSEILATHLGGELERLRFMLAELAGVTKWRSSAIRGPRVMGFLGGNNSALPNSRFDLIADFVHLRAAAGGEVGRVNTGTLVNDVALAGPVANGRDQSAAFTASSWIHFYFIWNGTTLATLSSAVAPPTGPTLPTGYTHWAFAATVRFTGSSTLVVTTVRGGWHWYHESESVVNVTSVPSTETSVALSGRVPPNAKSFSLFHRYTLTTNATGAASSFLFLRVSTGVNYLENSVIQHAVSSDIVSNLSILAPNIGQQLFYLQGSEVNPSNIATRSLVLVINGYNVSNGDV